MHISTLKKENVLRDRIISLTFKEKVRRYIYIYKIL